jgi:nitroimidazol reductase NimA-like FMN-containing flavoprotein (pyridoxamine 5'-phosphate oxidase superfamily)
MAEGERGILTGEELEEEIVEFLDRMSTRPGGKRTKPGCNMRHGKACGLGTCIDNEPRVTPVDFFSDGMTIWIAGEPGGKIANIMRNPKVALAIYEPVDHSKEQKSAQIWGTAELINVKHDPDEFARKIEAFGMKEAAGGVIEEFSRMGMIPKGQEEAALEKALKRFNFIKITPEKVSVLHMRVGQPPLKKVWEKGKVTITQPGL